MRLQNAWKAGIRKLNNCSLYYRENYLFICTCSRCNAQADDPDVTSEEEMEDDEFGDS